MSRLQERYRSQIVPSLKKKLSIDNTHAVPKLQKIVVSMGVGQSIQDRKILEEVAGHLGKITGQKPQITRSRKAVSTFRLRKGMEIGCRVTLRGKMMYEFLDRLVTLALPRVRDFRGLNRKSFDGRGNYSLGLNEQLVFPEVHPDSVKNTQGMNVTIVTSARNDRHGEELLRELGVPLQKES